MSAEEMAAALVSLLYGYAGRLEFYSDVGFWAIAERGGVALLNDVQRAGEPLAGSNVAAKRRGRT
jgi:hypothetical protein